MTPNSDAVPTPRLDEGVEVYMESNPNPDALKFVVNRVLVPEGLSFDFPSVASAAEAPLARELFTYSFVVRVFYMGNFITVTKKGLTEWIAVQGIVRTHIKNFVASGHAVINDSALVLQSQEGQAAPLVEKIKAALDEHIRPIVAQDGGAITFHSYANGVVKVSLQGACKGCPAATVTLKAGVEDLLKKMMPNEVVAVEALS